jgi:competence protein ComEC
MCYQALAVVSGIALFQFMPRVPQSFLYLSVIPLVLLLTRSSRWRILALFTIGFLWGMWRAELILDSRLEPARAGQVLHIVGLIISRPVDFGAGKRFDFKARQVTDQRATELRLSKLKLAWYDWELALATRARCELKVRLKLPYGTRNPGSFDGEKWMFIERVAATGYVVAHPTNRCEIAASKWSFDTVREVIAARIRSSVPDPSRHSVIAALAVADRASMSRTQWDTLRSTGTSHLLAISGLHISLVRGSRFSSRIGGLESWRRSIVVGRYSIRPLWSRWLRHLGMRRWQVSQYRLNGRSQC